MHRLLSNGVIVTLHYINYYCMLCRPVYYYLYVFLLLSKQKQPTWLTTTSRIIIKFENKWKIAVPSMVTNSFHTQQTPEPGNQHHEQPHHQQPQNHQVVAALQNGTAMTGCGLSPAVANPNPAAGMNTCAGIHRTISVPAMDQPTEQLQSIHSNASSFPSYTGLNIPNQSE